MIVTSMSMLLKYTILGKSF